MDGERIRKRIAGIAAELAELMAEPYDALTTAEQLALAAQWETVTRSQAVIGHRLVAELATAPVAELGETNAATALATLLRISKGEAHRRIHEAEDLGPRQALTRRGAGAGVAAYRRRAAARGHRWRAREDHSAVLRPAAGFRRLRDPRAGRGAAGRDRLRGQTRGVAAGRRPVGAICSTRTANSPTGTGRGGAI